MLEMPAIHASLETHEEVHLAIARDPGAGTVSEGLEGQIQRGPHHRTTAGVKCNPPIRVDCRGVADGAHIAVAGLGAPRGMRVCVAASLTAGTPQLSPTPKGLYGSSKLFS